MIQGVFLVTDIVTERDLQTVLSTGSKRPTSLLCVCKQQEELFTVEIALTQAPGSIDLRMALS